MGAAWSRRHPRTLFVTGCERSGTTALLFLLNADERIVLGRERFKFIRPELGPEHLREEHFFHPVPEETNYLDRDYYRELKERWASGGVVYLGDKNPRYWEYLRELPERFPTAKFVFILRDLYRVASSYNVRAANEEDAAWPEVKNYAAAVRDWNGSLRAIREFLETHGGRRGFLLEHALLFSGNASFLEALYRFLALEPTEAVRARYEELCREWEGLRRKALSLTPEMIEHLEAHRDRETEVWCLARSFGR